MFPCEKLEIKGGGTRNEDDIVSLNLCARFSYINES